MDVDDFHPYQCYHCNAGFQQQADLSKHSSEFHQHLCIYCSTTCSNFDEYILHATQAHLFLCYYCTTSFMHFDNIVNHSEEHHGTKVLKVRYLELNPTNGRYGYRSHNFNVIPNSIKSDGHRIKTYCDSDSLKIHICKDESTELTTISSPLAKRQKTTISEVHNSDDQIKLDIDKDTYETDHQNDTVEENNENISEEETLTKLIPSVIKTLKADGKLDVWVKFNELIAKQLFPMDNIAFLLFLDVVKLYSSNSTTEMRYTDSAVNKFWRIGYKMFHGRWLRYMSGPKNKSDLISGISSVGHFDPKTSRVNFCVPFAKVTGTSEAPVPSSQVKPGVLSYLLDKIGQQANKDKTFKLCFDGKKINSSIAGTAGDIDLFGFEGSPTLEEKQMRLEKEKASITTLTELLKDQSINNINYMNKMPHSSRGKAIDSFRLIIHILSLRLMSLKEAKLSKETALIKFKTMAGQDWRKSRLLHVISALETCRLDIQCCISDIINLELKLGSALACLCGTATLYSVDEQISLGVQANYIHLSDLDNPDKDLRFTKQRSSSWFAIRKEAIVTGSTLNGAIGLDSFKKQLQHFDQVVNNTEPPEFSDVVKKRMQRGVENEINAVATLVARFLPIYHPDLSFVEEGCYKIDLANGQSMIISPDGSCRDANDKAVFGVEIKCPAPKDGIAFKTLLHYSLPKYYVPQVLSEMYALQVDKLLYICYTSESTTFLTVNFDADLWYSICSELDLYTSVDRKRPTKRSENLPNIQASIDTFIKQNVMFLCELKSCTGHECSNDLALNSTFCRHESQGTESFKMTLQSAITYLRDGENKLEMAYNLTRSRASEFLGFMLSDLDRNYKEEEFHSVPIAYGLKGYSLSNQIMRKMMEYVLQECNKRGLYVPVCSFDGQWYSMTVRNKKTNL